MLNIEKIKELITDKNSIAQFWTILYDAREELYKESLSQAKNDKSDAYTHTLVETQVLTSIMQSLEEAAELEEGQQFEKDPPYTGIGA